ncbi:hypothetical protein HID58_082982 [Brassica napus]|uniref:HTH cro/C1-type domain-containing protein n=1 Tax=Brassica napus TaxID=3708 RepID=A0ABQ7YCA0_BRANA|nr:hypothetical protein HID58_082982 [Brassica napus]
MLQRAAVLDRYGKAVSRFDDLGDVVVVNGRESKGWLEITQLYFKSNERVPTELKKSIMQARGEKKLTHSQLAQLINEKPQVIQEYESGKARLVS